MQSLFCNHIQLSGAVIQVIQNIIKVLNGFTRGISKISSYVYLS